MTYTLECDEPHYVRTRFTEDGTLTSRDVDTEGKIDDKPAYYWITSTEKEEVLALNNISEAEKILKRLREGESFKDIAEDKDAAQIQERRPCKLQAP